MTKDINSHLRANPVNSSRGAPMGARGKNDSEQSLYLQALDMVDGDYDRSGVYWGCRSAKHGGMYCAFSEDLETVIYVRARSRAEAKSLIEADYDVTFIR